MKFLQFLKEIKPEDRYFLFTDGSTRKEANPPVIGLGAELRDKNGALVMTYSEEIKISDLPEDICADASEKYALAKALKICLNEGIKKLVVNTDSSGLSTKLNIFIEAKNIEGEQYRGMMNTQKRINFLIYEVADKFSELFIEYIPREKNKHADFYSRSAKSLIKDYAGIHYQSNGERYVNLNTEATAKKSIAKYDTIKGILNTSLSKNIEYFHKKPSSSLAIAPLDLLKLNNKNSFIDEKVMNIDVQEFNEGYSIRFFYGDGEDRNIKEFKMIKILENEGQRIIPLVFVLYNIVSGLSDYNLKEAYEEDNRYLNFKYSNDLWDTFNDVLGLSYMKNRIYMPKKMIFEIEREMKNCNKLKDILGDKYEKFSEVMLEKRGKFIIHHTIDQQRLYLTENAIMEAREKNHRLNIAIR